VVQDTGLSVRKRVVRLLKSLYNVVSGDKLKTEIACKLVGRVLDEDDHVKVGFASTTI
jgi:cohesin loading factor subunit SCC2